MGFSSSKQEDKKIKEKQNKYFTAYKRVKRIHEDIHNKVLEEESGIVQDVYLIKISTIPKYLNILKNWKILEKIAERQRSEVHEKEEEMKKDFKDYELENNVKDCIDISKEDFKKNFSKDFKGEKFIIVDKEFNEIMEILYGNDEKVNINVNKLCYLLISHFPPHIVYLKFLVNRIVLQCSQTIRSSKVSFLSSGKGLLHSLQ